MSELIYRYQLDPDGNKPDNLVQNEVHKLSALPVRAVAPKYGLFFTESLVVRDIDANRVLAKSEYRIVELSAEATIRYSKPIAALILITNTNVSENVSVTYQVLGGHYTHSAAAVGSMYETWLKDNRPVPWLNVMNKPTEFRPGPHPHVLEDVYGFEPIIISLERVADALILRNIPAFEAIVDYVANVKVPEVTVEDVLSYNQASEGVVTMRRLALAMQHLNFNAITVTPNTLHVRNGAQMFFDVRTTAIPDNERLYWRIRHISTTAADFVTTAGSMIVNGNESRFTFQLGVDPDLKKESKEEFRIEICRESALGPVLYTTGVFSIAERNINAFLLARLKCCYKEPRTRRTVLNSYCLGR